MLHIIWEISQPSEEFMRGCLDQASGSFAPPGQSVDIDEKWSHQMSLYLETLLPKMMMFCDDFYHQKITYSTLKQ